ncbi:MAG TPA: MotA/TolQ/ExbB proton channel family protein [Rhodanobacteraceae bacterium]
MSGTDWAVLIVLIIMSACSWFFIIFNGIRNAMVRSRSEKVVRQFWDAGSAQDSIRAMEEQPAGEPFSKIALDCAMAATHHQKADAGALADSLDRSEFIDRALRQSIARESVRLESGLTLLAAVGSAAVYVGLLGTVLGIVHALVNIGSSGQASITTVAGPVGQALYMTALGLVTAIPAVLAYNFFARANRVTLAQFDDFAHDLHDFFVTGSRRSSDNN